MKKSIKLISIFCVILVVISLFPAEIFASEDKFVKIKVTSIDDSGNKNINEELFYCKNNEFYISNYTIVKYTMYDYDEENNAFVRVGQAYKNSTSKIKINESDNTVDVWSLLYHKTHDCDIYKFNEYYFLPLAKIASYLKATVTYVDDNSICITSSGYSIADAMYNFNKDVKFMDDIKIIDDLFYGNEAAYKRYCVLGYMGETMFNSKLSNIVGLGSYETYCDIMESAVNNNDVYNELMINDNLLIDVLDFSQDTYENIYKKVSKVPKLSSSAITTMFEEYKENNSFGDTDTLFNNFFESEELEVAPIKEFGDTISVVSDYLETANYLCDYFRMNEDNRSAIEYVSSAKSNSNEMSAIRYIGGLYNDDFVKSTSTKLVSKISEELVSESVKEIGLGKVKLATGISNEVFKLLGFDLSDNSSYDIMLANDLKRVILNNCKEYETEKLLKPSNSENLRLAMIMTLLVEIEAYEMANKVAKKTGLSGYYDDDIEYLNKRLALFYKAKESQNYDDFESIKRICDENQQQLQKIDLEKLDIVSQEETETILHTDKSCRGILLSFFESYTDLVISFVKNYEFEGYTDYGHMRIIDINMDGYPDLTLSQFSAGGGHGGISNVYLYHNGSFEEIMLDDDFESTYLQLATDSQGNQFISNGKPEPYNTFNDFYTPSVFGKVIIKNGKLDIEVIYDEYSESNTPEKYFKVINENYQFNELSDYSTINFHFDLDDNGNGTFKLTLSEEEIQDAIIDFFGWDYEL